MKKTAIILSFLVLFIGCSGRTIDVKSPCVSREDGPCGLRKPINDWWMKSGKIS